jgi:hypothetical protein
MSIALEIKRDISLNFPIDEVKKAIKTVSNSSKGKVMLKNENDVMNTFSLQVMGGMLVFVPMNIQLKKISDNETNLLLNTTKSTNTPNQSNEIIDKFLDNLSKALTGELKETEANPKGGCAGIFLALITIGGLTIYYTFS